MQDLGVLEGRGTTLHCKKCGVSEHPRGACFHGNPYCYHGNSKILLPWGVQLHHIFNSVVGGGGGGGGRVQSHYA